MNGESSAEPMTRQKAKMCLSMNLAFPGSGSLMARRLSGYPQALMALCGLLMTTGFGIRFVGWFLQNWSRLSNPTGDPMQNLVDMWQTVRWVLAGMALFGVSWIWGLLTGFSIISKAKKQDGENGSGKGPPPVPGPPPIPRQ